MRSKNRLGRRSGRGRSSRAHIIGVVVSEITSDTAIATARVTENSRNRRPTMPPISRMGMNTAIRDRLIDSTVKPTSRAPSRAACIGAMPASICRHIFSSTTTASSTTKPVAMVSAISDRLLMLKPARYMTPKLPSSDTGTATAGISAARTLRRNSTTTTTTRAIAISSARSTSVIEARMVLVRSIMTSRLMSPGIEARSWGSSSRTRSVVPMMLAPGWRLSTTNTAGRPLAEPAVRTSCTESTTSAMSERRTAAPLRYATMMGA